MLKWEIEFLFLQPFPQSANICPANSRIFWQIRKHLSRNYLSRNYFSRKVFVRIKVTQFLRLLQSYWELPFHLLFDFFSFVDNYDHQVSLLLCEPLHSGTNWNISIASLYLHIITLSSQRKRKMFFNEWRSLLCTRHRKEQVFYKRVAKQLLQVNSFEC